MSYPLVLDLAVDTIPVTVTCRVLGFSTQAFYTWRKNPVSQRDWDDAHLTNAALDIHHDDPAFGYRFIADELAEQGLPAGENRVARLCSQQRIFSVHANKRGRNRKAGPPVHEDLVDRQFSAAAPNLLWLTDITEHRTAEGKLYLCAVKDVASNKIVGYSIDSRMKAALAVAALRNAIALRDPAGTIVHSDRGSQFRSNTYLRTLKNNGLVGSMGRVGACADNAAMESVFALLQKNVLDRQRWTTREEARTVGEQARTIAEGITDVDGRAEALVMLATAFARMGDHRLALEVLIAAWLTAGTPFAGWRVLLHIDRDAATKIAKWLAV